MSPRATTRPSCASITNTLRLLCTSSPTYDSIGLPSSLSLGRIATPWLAVDLTAAEGSPPSSIRVRALCHPDPENGPNVRYLLPAAGRYRWRGCGCPDRRGPAPRRRSFASAAPPARGTARGSAASAASTSVRRPDSTYPAPPAAAETVRWLFRILLASFHVSRMI